MLTEHHCHILPQIDDGSRSVEMSLKMIGMMRAQGVNEIFATPHFYAHREKDIASYLAKRQAALQKLVDADASNASIRLGAEVAIEHGISQMKGIEQLRLGDTDYILLELPYGSFSHWQLEEINEIACEYGLTPIIAHIHRYLDDYSRDEMDVVLRTDAVFQINNEAFGNHKEKKFVKSLIRDGYPYLFGSDAHNLDDRRPNWDLLKKKVRQDVLDEAVHVLK
ncbi:MAG: capsular polysaccharide biosynthesis protein [Oscillospiraceae bacterium]|nr:capsular polysaccharide biosynthesis protein [Oscillospiraceae bacterium]